MSAIAQSTEVWEILNRNIFFVKNAVKRLEAKTSDKFDVYDPNNRELVLECREADLGAITKARRLAGGHYDTGSPFNYVATMPGSDQQVLRISRRVPFLSIGKPSMEVYDSNDVQIASLKTKFFSLSQSFIVSLSAGVQVLKVKHKGLTGYRFVLQDKEVATMTSKWNGHQSDYFGQGFDYAVSIADDVPPNDRVRPLVLAFALAIKRILKAGF
ncbi:MAG TPA: hypothetical protein VLT36_17900 [Candidatus Dormibacteraeota bacterium]|nr:hypothetical protein [Candidatus Dormibacteraeota bacterium]